MIRKEKPYALLMIKIGRREIQRHAPANFYDWTERAKKKYIAKRWPAASWVGNGDPRRLRYVYLKPRSGRETNKPDASSPGTVADLISALGFIGDPLEPEGNTSFSRLSQTAQNAVVWAAMAGDGEEPPKLSDEVRAELAAWISETDAPGHQFANEHLGIPYRPSIAEIHVRNCAEEYHRRTEHHDQVVCTGRSDEGVALPASPIQSRLVHDNALIVYEDMLSRAGCDRKTWQAAVADAGMRKKYIH